MEIAKKGLKERLAALVAAGLVASAMAMPTAAFADNSARAGDQSGTGTTSLNMITVDDGSEHSETGANVAFSFPSSLNYVVAADGKLTGPEPASACIQNNSVFPIHMSSVKTAEVDGWHFVSAIGSATEANSVELNLTPNAAATGKIGIADYKAKTADIDNLTGTVASKWGMGEGAKIELASDGAVAKVNKDITSTKQFGTVQWFVKAGPVS